MNLCMRIDVTLKAIKNVWFQTKHLRAVYPGDTVTFVLKYDIKEKK